jgi:hypothetical protein
MAYIKRPRTKKLTSKEILALPVKEMFPAVIKQGFGTGIHKMIMDRVKKRVFFDSRENFYRSMARNLKNNVEALQTHYNMTEGEFTNQVIQKTSFSNSPRHGANFLLEGTYDYNSLHDMAFSIGFSFNISLDQLLHSNIELLFMKDLQEGFEFYACEPYDIIHLSQ